MCYLSYCKFVCSILWIILIEKKRWWLDIGPCNWKWLLSKADFQTSEIKYTLKWNLLHIKLLHIFQQIIHMISCSFLLKVDICLCNLSLVSEVQVYKEFHFRVSLLMAMWNNFFVLTKMSCNLSHNHFHLPKV